MSFLEICEGCYLSGGPGHVCFPPNSLSYEKSFVVFWFYDGNGGKMLQEQVTPTVQGPSQAVQGFGPGCCCAFAHGSTWSHFMPMMVTLPPQKKERIFQGAFGRVSAPSSFGRLLLFSLQCGFVAMVFFSWELVAKAKLRLVGPVVMRGPMQPWSLVPPTQAPCSFSSSSHFGLCCLKNKPFLAVSHRSALIAAAMPPLAS